MNRREMARAGGVFAGLAVMGAMAAKPAMACSDDDLKKAIEEMRQAMVDVNGARLLELMSDDCTFGHANAVVQTKLEFVNNRLVPRRSTRPRRRSRSSRTPRRGR